MRTPDGKILTKFRKGPGPHTGVHLIIVRDDLSTIIHKHPPIPASGRLALPVTFSRPGRYHVLVDVYPASSALPRNFQLTHELQVGTTDVKAPLPAYAPVVKTGGLTFTVAKLPDLTVAVPGTMVVNVTEANGKPVTFTPFYGALAHAIFFRVGTLDYFHSHICGTDPACSAGFGTPATTGHSTKPGRLELGVLLPAAGRWRLFLQVTHGGKLITAAVYIAGAMRRREHLAGLLLGLVLVVLGGRALAYAATPTPLSGELGGPRLPVITLVALATGALLSLGVLWLAALGVRERHALASAPGPAPRLRSPASAPTPSLLGGGSLATFAGLETWIHARAGMHMHWWACLEGPVHRNAIPILLALSLAAAALLAASRHALAWARRVVHVLRRLAAASRGGSTRSRSLASPRPRLRGSSSVRVRVRGPPALSIP